MNDYQHFTIPDFMQDARFRAWVLAGEPGANKFWNEWVASHPDRQADVLQARELLEGIYEGFDELSDTELNDRVRATIAKITDPHATPNTLIIRRLWPVPVQTTWLVAASICLVLLGGWYILNRRVVSSPAASPYQTVVAQAGSSLREISTETTASKLIQLPDGSQITLAPRSRLSYDSRLNRQQQRLVYLTGGAFFSVKRDPARPFLVYANGIVTKVLGTSFSIQAYDGQSKITVAVRSGRVSVFAPEPATASNGEKSVFGRLVNGIVLTANQQATYQPQTDQLLKTIVERPVVIHPDQLPTQTVFTDAPVGRLFDQLEKAYSITIHYNATDFKDCLLTAKLNDEPLVDKIKLICASIGASYEIVDAQIFISGSGCK